MFRFSIKEGKIDRVVFGADFVGMSERDKTKLQSKAADKLLSADTILTLLRHLDSFV